MTLDRVHRLRLALRDLAAAAAFGTLAVSGQIPPFAVGLFGLALALGLAGRRPLAGRGTAAALVLMAAGGYLVLQVATARLDLVIAACTFAALLCAHRLLSEPTPSTDGQVHLSSLLMIAGGAALSAELFYALFLIAFAAAACFSLGFSVVAHASAVADRFPARPVARQLASGLGMALVLCAALFVLFPRLSWNLAGRRVTPGLGAASSGFSDRVQLGGDGTIKTNPRVVLRARLDPDPGKDQLEAYWLGRTYEHFDGRQWLGTAPPLPSQMRVILGHSGEGMVRQQIELLPAYGSRTLIALQTPVLFADVVALEGVSRNRTSIAPLGDQEVRADATAVSYTYQAYSVPVASAPPAPLEPGRYLKLPEGLDPRVAELARQVAGDEEDPLRVAERLQRYLQSEYRYTLELEDGDQDPLAHFLFVRKAGHCEHFATALTVLLRTLGIPARVASGFYGGQRLGDAFVVRAGDAHAWTQVHVPERGFVTVDATPESFREAAPAAVSAWFVQQFERLESLWRSRVLDYSLQDQFALADRVVNRSASRASPGMPDLRQLVGLLLALGGAVLLVRLVRSRTRARPHQATELLEATERLLATVALRIDPGSDLEELSRRLSDTGHPVAPALSRVTRRYLQARFGAAPLREGETEALVAQLGRAVRDQTRATR